MHNVSKFLHRYQIEILVCTALVVLFFFLRFYNIMSLPIFTDEAIYVRWAQIAGADASWRFISVADGKQPSFVWLTMILLRVIPDPLFAGRLVSVGAGFLTTIGIFLLGRELFKNTWVGIVSALLYVIYPMALVYNRMALYESLVGMFAIWGLYVQVLLVRRLRLDIALVLALVMGGGYLTKSSNFFSVYLLPFSLLIFDWKAKHKYSRLLKFIGLAAVAIALTYLYYSILRLTPLFFNISQKDVVFIYSFEEWKTHPFKFFVGNFLGLWDWFIIYLKWPFVILIPFSLLVMRSYWREKILLALWCIIPILLLAMLGKVLYPRYILHMTLPLLPLIAVSLVGLFSLIRNKIIFAIVCLVVFALPLFTDYKILTDFSTAPIPGSDSEQYINSWPAGGGMREITAYLKEESKKGKIYVASEGTFGSIPTFYLEIYEDQNRNIEKRGIWPLPLKMPKDLLEKAKHMSVYFIFNQTQVPPLGWPVELVAKYQKGIGNWYIFLYKVVPQNEAR